MEPGWYFMDDPLLEDLPDGYRVILLDIDGHRQIGFRRHGAWLSDYGTPIHYKIEQICILPPAKER